MATVAGRFGFHPPPPPPRPRPRPGRRVAFPAGQCQGQNLLLVRKM
ncbi:hypothetical protein ACP70R_028815 [Stipagrostis hirtigluma subsp. patula]